MQALQRRHVQHTLPAASPHTFCEDVVPGDRSAGAVDAAVIPQTEFENPLAESCVVLARDAGLRKIVY